MMKNKFYITRLCVVLLYFFCFPSYSEGAASDIQLDAKAQSNHRLDSLNLLSYTLLLILTVLTIWLFKHRRVSFLHETGLAVIYGLIVGAIIRYSGSSSRVLNMQVYANDPQYNSTLPPDTLSLHFPTSGRPKNNKTFQYVFREEIVDLRENEIDFKATFDPEIFFNIILPPIIFHAGYSLKRKYFFRNLGAILTYAIIGTTVSSFVVGALMYGCVQLMPARLASSFTFLDTLYFGALISSTDPLTILAIFNDLNVDVNLYALVFGESVLNDAVAIVLSGFLNDKYMTKFTRVRDFPLLESALFVLMSYSTFLIAEASELTGVVSVLFCGICQAHYTYNNLSEESRTRTKHMFDLLNFLAENFIFSYIGVSMFTFPKHHFDPLFILAGFSMCTTGLRGAMSFALAIRNTLSEQRQAMLTTTSLIVIITVIIQGGATMNLLNWFKIPVGIDDETEALSHQGVHSGNTTPRADWNEVSGSEYPKQQNEKAFLARIWGSFDTCYMKPLLTHSRPTLLETLPVCCNPLARLLTTTEQMTQEGPNKPMRDSDSDLCIEENDFSNNDNTRSSSHRKVQNW
ncbi:hypothetical protein NQ318_021148 [Aromia moschata]|uniref:Cation/H+ exchanger transmembrane domain-containing protein n=1 Tax=Aromia moschata TaxID=1265417 RepID=A0AAV8YEZ7_9CUCU|nr:hypothetical protein NQ318_021148 [Aromia moschata]